MNYSLILKKILILLCLIILAGYKSYSQEKDSLIFAKGRILTSLFGSLSNQRVDIGSNETANTTGYSIGTKSGYFIRNQWAMGLNFSLSRIDYQNSSIDIESENLVLGYWNRVYFLQIESAALHAEITPYFTSIYRQNLVYDNNGVVITNERVSGNGVGIEPGLGFTYIVNRNVGFGITITYSWTQLNINREDRILNITSPNTYNVNQLGFSFSFQIYIDQFFF